MKTILVTGSKGFIGSNLYTYFTRQDCNLRGLDAEYFLEGNWVDSLLKELDDIQPDVIFHVGACSNTLEKNVQIMMEQNYESTKIITDWCVKNSRQIIYSSSAANYGINGIYPSNLYGWSKYVAEAYVIKSGGVALRYFNVYGAGENDKGTMASFIFQAFLNKLSGRPVTIFPGKPKRDFIYIKDVVSANAYAMKNYDKFSGNFYEVSTGQSSTFEQLMDLADIKYSYLDEKTIPSGYQLTTCGDPKKWLSGWSPKYFLEEGVNEYLKILTKQFK